MIIDSRKYLTENILPFWINNAIDKENGGIYTCVDAGGKVYSTTKSVWFQGRSLWSFAMAYNTVEKRGEYLEICENLYNFLNKCSDSTGRLPYTVTKSGEAIVKRDYYYSETFAAIGCAQYYKACGKKEVWESAERYFDICARLYKNPETRVVEMSLGKDAHKVFGINMIMLSTVQFMRNVGINTKKYDDMASLVIDEMKNGGYVNDELKAVVDHVDLDGNFQNTKWGISLCPGHAYEAAWFVLSEAELKNDDSLRVFGKKLLDYAMPHDYFNKYHLVPTFREAGREPYNEIDSFGYRWWPQCEAVIAYALAYNIFKDEKYKLLSEKILCNALKYFEDKNSSEWYAFVDYDMGVSKKIKGDELKGPFHLPRMLMGLISLEETGGILKYMS